MIRETEYKSEAYGDTTFNNIELGSVAAATAFGEQKVILDGVFSLNLVKTAKFNENELQIQVFSKHFEEKHRYHRSWNRTEIFLKPDMIPKLIDGLVILQKKLQDSQ